MATYSSTQAVDAMKRRVKKFVKKDVPRAGSVAGEIYGNVKYNRLKGADKRLVRGGFGDALLNTDDPKPRLVQKQMGMVQRAAAKDNLKAAGMVVSAPAIVGKSATAMAARAAKKGLKDRKTGKFVSKKFLKRLRGKIKK